MNREEADHPTISLEKLTTLRLALKKRTMDLENDEYVWLLFWSQ